MNFRIIKLTDKNVVTDYINKLPDVKTYDVYIKIHHKKRTIPQNRLYFSWINCIHDETGNDKDSIHDFFKQKYLGFEKRTCFGETIFKNPSTKVLDTKQFTDYLNKIQVYASTELGIRLPNPEDLYFEQFYEKYKDLI